MDKTEPDTGLSFERVVFFSDAVFAIVITLLVLELKVPHLSEHTETTLRSALIELVPNVAGFVISFLIIGLMWIEHHRIFRYIENYDAGLLWRNLFLLLCVSFVPFPTALFSENFWSRTAFILYTGSFGAVVEANRDARITTPHCAALARGAARVCRSDRVVVHQYPGGAAQLHVHSAAGALARSDFKDQN
jgi:transmembrane protein TMEM174 (potassium channel)